MTRNRLYEMIEEMDVVFYVSNDKKLYMLDIRDKALTDYHGYPWYKGAFGNCLIALENTKITDKLYLLTRSSRQKIMSKGFGRTNKSAEEILEKRVALLEKYANKIITREDL